MINRSPRLLTTIAIALPLAFANIFAANAPRLVRLGFVASESTWFLQVNHDPAQTNLSDTATTNALEHLRLRWRDIILLGSNNLQSLSAAKATQDWSIEYCRSNQVAIYLATSSSGIDVSCIPVFYWTAPFQNPFDSRAAKYFEEGKSLGKGDAGFTVLLGLIARNHPKRLLILGSLYDMDRSFPPDAAPYEKRRTELYAVLRSSGTDLIHLEPLP
ncbi:MAG TPA: hypothetical protein VGW37_18645 [Terriglobia bacterium]|nr:hypothetical protein [Terriglobia bacterium]